MRKEALNPQRFCNHGLAFDIQSIYTEGLGSGVRCRFVQRRRGAPRSMMHLWRVSALADVLPKLIQCSKVTDHLVTF